MPADSLTRDCIGCGRRFRAHRRRQDFCSTCRPRRHRRRGRVQHTGFTTVASDGLLRHAAKQLRVGDGAIT